MNAAHSDGQKEEGSCPRTPQPGQVLPTWTGISCGHPRSDFPSLGGTEDACGGGTQLSLGTLCPVLCFFSLKELAEAQS